MPNRYSRTPSYGSRSPRYVWQPSFAPAKRSRRRKGARPYHRRTSELDLSDHFRRPWLHDYEPKNWTGGDGIDFRLRNDPRFAGVRLLNVLLYHCFLMAGLAVVGIGYLILSIGRAEKTRQIHGESSRKVLRLGRTSSIHEPPTSERLREAWNASRSSLEGKLLLGSLVSDIEPVVDRSYIRSEDGAIVGRRPGIKGWLSRNCPDLVPHYKALMSYKLLADKMRLALGISDPDSLEEALVLVMERQAPGNAGQTSGKTEAKTSLNADDKAAKGGERCPKSMAINISDKLLNEIILKRSYKIRELLSGLTRQSLAALEAAVREKLGLVWMTRGRKRRQTA